MSTMKTKNGVLQNLKKLDKYIKNSWIWKPSNETGFSVDSIQISLRVGIKLFQYQIEILQVLSKEDCAHKMQISKEILKMIEKDADFH